MPPDLSPVPSPNAMHVCASCGAISPLEGPVCKRCGDQATVALAPVRPDGVMFALVLESDFQCRGCGLRSALDSLYLEPQVDCHRCGMTQAFDVSHWKDALAHAHAVADLSGPPPAGQGSLRHGRPLSGKNPFDDLGVRFTFAELTQSGMTISAAGMVTRSLRVKVATGHPVCPSGHGPLTVEVAGPEGDSSTRVMCTQCNDPATYMLPRSKTAALSRECVGLIDDEHRRDRQVVRMDPSAAGGGAVALTCPRCNASLPATQVSSVVTCQFCNTVSYIPKRAFFKLNPESPSRPFWLLFRGPSSKRAGAHGDEEESPPTAPAPAVAPGAPGAPPTPAATMAQTFDPAARRPRSKLPMVIAAVAVVVVGVAIVAVVALRSHESRPTPAQHATPHRPHH